MKKLALILTIASLILLCGCAGYREIDHGYLVTAIGFRETNEGVTIIAEAVSSNSNNTESNATMLSANGKTITDAYNALKTHLVMPLYFEHLGAIIIEDSITQNKLPQLLEFCSNLQSVSLGLYVVTTQDLSSLFDTQAASGFIGYDIIGLIKNHNNIADNNTENQLYQLQKQLLTDDKVSLPSVTTVQGQLTLELTGAVV